MIYFCKRTDFYMSYTSKNSYHIREEDHGTYIADGKKLTDSLQPQADKTKDSLVAEIDAYLSENHQLSLKQRSIYLLPNLFTTGALFAGFSAIFATAVGQYEQAIIAILIAALLDSMDGRVARLTHTQSAFGAHYDSLSDLVAFGVAPALLVFVWQLQSMGKLAWGAAFIYGAGAALRLARFNVETCSAEPADNTENVHASGRYFIGLPSPAAAIAIVSLLWVLYRYTWFNTDTDYLLLLALPLVGLLMISNIPYFSFKCLPWNRRVSFTVNLLVLLVFVGLLLEPALSLLAMTTFYIVINIAVRCFAFRHVFSLCKTKKL